MIVNTYRSDSDNNYLPKILFYLKQISQTVGKPFYYLLLTLLLASLSSISIVTGALDKKQNIKYSLLKIKLKRETLNRNQINSKAKKRKKTNLLKRFAKISLYVLLLFILVLLIALLVIWYIYLKDLPSAQSLSDKPQIVSTKIYDRNGELLYKIYDDKNRTPIKLKEVPIMVRQATLAAEDAEFYQHPGFSIKGILRSVVHNYKNEGELTGGSTITQQLVKNTLLSPEKTFERKLKEIVLAFKVELNFNKNEILEMYLNEVSYGGTAYGIQEASIHYFGKDVSDLTLGEASLLAGLPKSPTRYSPFGKNPEYAFSRQKDILRLMKINGFITKIEMEKAQSEFISFAPNIVSIKAPHFVIYTKQILESQYGQDLVGKRGLEVTTTLDYGIQQMAEKIMKEEIEKLASLSVGNGAAIIMDSKTAEILAMVGSADYFNDESGKINLTTTKRQPGSSIKIVNYAYALSNGMTAATIINDSPITFDLRGQDPYTPKNYDGNFKGNLTLRNAFAQSRNVPAVKVLNFYGVESMLNMGKKMGISTWDDPRGYGLSLTLGGGEVRLIDLARVYQSVANEGKLTNLNSILHIKDYQDNTLFTSLCVKDNASELEFQKECEQSVLDSRVAFIVTDILKDNKARSPAFGTNSQLNIPGHPEVAVKTGTSNDLKDNLTVGFTKDYVVAVWVGNNDNSPMSRIASGLTGASTIFNKIMVELLKTKESYTVEPPSGIVKLLICPYTGTLSCGGCPNVTEYFLEENVPQRCNSSWFKEKENTSQIQSESPN